MRLVKWSDFFLSYRWANMLTAPFLLRKCSPPPIGRLLHQGSYEHRPQWLFLFPVPSSTFVRRAYLSSYKLGSQIRVTNYTPKPTKYKTSTCHFIFPALSCKLIEWRDLIDLSKWQWDNTVSVYKQTLDNRWITLPRCPINWQLSTLLLQWHKGDFRWSRLWMEIRVGCVGA